LGLSLIVHLTLLLALVGPRWLIAVLAVFSTVAPPPLPSTPYTLTILTPPPGKPLPSGAVCFQAGACEKMTPGVPLKIADSADIVFDADDTRQLVPVLKAYGGLIVFVPLLHRASPKAAFWPDGSRAAVPATLDHWVRIRLSNPSYWPEVGRLCAIANSDGLMEAVAAFPPEYRSQLGAAVQSRMIELKSSGHVVGVGLRLEAGRPAGVAIRAITLASTRQIG